MFIAIVFIATIIVVVDFVVIVVVVVLLVFVVAGIVVGVVVGVGDVVVSVVNGVDGIDGPFKLIFDHKKGVLGVKCPFFSGDSHFFFFDFILQLIHHKL